MKKSYTLTFDEYMNSNSYTSTLSTNPIIEFTQTTTNDKYEPC